MTGPSSFLFVPRPPFKMASSQASCYGPSPLCSPCVPNVPPNPLKQPRRLPFRHFGCFFATSRVPRGGQATGALVLTAPFNMGRPLSYGSISLPVPRASPCAWCCLLSWQFKCVSPVAPSYIIEFDDWPLPYFGPWPLSSRMHLQFEFTPSLEGCMSFQPAPLFLFSRHSTRTLPFSFDFAHVFASVVRLRSLDGLGLRSSPAPRRFALVIDLNSVLTISFNSYRVISSRSLILANCDCCTTYLTSFHAFIAFPISRLAFSGFAFWVHSRGSWGQIGRAHV